MVLHISNTKVLFHPCPSSGVGGLEECDIDGDGVVDFVILHKRGLHPLDILVAEIQVADLVGRSYYSQVMADGFTDLLVVAVACRRYAVVHRSLQGGGIEPADADEQA